MERPTEVRKFYVAHTQRWDLVGGFMRFVIAVDDNPVVERRLNGQSHFMTYRSRRGAEARLSEVRATLPGAVVKEKA